MDEIRQAGATPAAGARPESGAPEFDRLVRAVEGLIDRYQALRDEAESLRRELAERDEQLRVLNQRRQDAHKRIDDLIEQIAHLDARFAEPVGDAP